MSKQIQDNQMQMRISSSNDLSIMNNSTIMIENEDMELDLVTLYLTSISLKEFKAYEIAKSHLGTSFDIERSNGFLEWKKKNYAN
jgi:hypothetical protein